MSKIIYQSNGIVLQRVMSGNSPLLVSNENRHILIDTGIKKNWDKITLILDSIIKESKLTALIITHTHYDHIENINCIKEKYNPIIIIHKNESEFISNGITPLSTGDKFNICKLTQREFDSIDTYITFEKEINLNNYGFKAKVIWTPGHSPGSISIIVNNDIAITGDSLGGMEKKKYAKSINIVSNEIQRSWEKLLALKCKKYIPSHGTKELEYEDLLSMYKKYKILKQEKLSSSCD